MENLKMVFENASIAVNVIEKKSRKITWNNQVFNSFFDQNGPRKLGTKCWEQFHPEKPYCEECEKRGAIVRFLNTGGKERCFLTNTTEYTEKFLYKIVEDLGNVFKHSGKACEQCDAERKNLKKIAELEGRQHLLALYESFC